MIEWRWGLSPLTVRDASANNLAAALDFTQARAKPPRLPAPPGPFGRPCRLPAPVTDPVDLASLVTLARATGWPL
jgi:phospholipase C